MYVLGRMAVPESKTGECLGVSLELLSHLVGRQVPQAGNSIGAGGEHVLRIGRKGHVPNPPLVFNGQFLKPASYISSCQEFASGLKNVGNTRTYPML